MQPRHIDRSNLRGVFEDIVSKQDLWPEKGQANMFRGRCPAHESKSGTSFIVRLIEDRILIKCFGGCQVESIVDALGYEIKDLFDRDDHALQSGEPQPRAAQAISLEGSHHATTTVYRYLDRHGTEIYTVRRDDVPGKEKVIRPWLAGAKRPGLDKRIRRVPYNLGVFAYVRAKGEPLYFCEGEKCAQRLIDAGLHATCIAGGADAWDPYATDYTHHFQGVKVAILPDNDEPGIKLARKVEQDLKGIADSTAIIQLPGLKAKEDVVEWLDKYDNPVESLSKLTDAVLGKPSSKAIISETAFDLLNADIDPMHYIVPGLLPEGTFLLAGKKGVRKSMLALNIAVGVASGSMVLGAYPTDPGGVLYLALDDPRRRLKERLQRGLFQSSPREAMHHLEFWYKSPRLNENLLKRFATYLEENSHTKLVIIDMLARIRPPSRIRGDFYQEENDFMSEIRELMAEHRACCLILHHTRKADADDIFDTMIGTQGLLGATDGGFVLKGARADNGATLHAMGNDLEGSPEIGLMFDPVYLTWNVADALEDVTLTRVKRQVYEYLKACGAPQNIGQVSDKLGIKYDTAKHTLSRLKEIGVVERDRESMYYIHYVVPSVPLSPSVPSVPSVPFSSESQGTTSPSLSPVCPLVCPQDPANDPFDYKGDRVIPEMFRDAGDNGDNSLKVKPKDGDTIPPKKHNSLKDNVDIDMNELFKIEDENKGSRGQNDAKNT